MLRAVFGIALLIQAGFYLREPDAGASAWFVGLAAVVGGIFLLVGFLTPVAGVAVGLGAIAIALSLLPGCLPSLFETKTNVAFAVTMLLAIIVLGPGAISIDARLFGRREIIIPSANPFSR